MLKSKKTVILVALIIMGLTISSLTSGALARPKVRVSIYPLYDTALKIADDKLDISQVIPNGVEVHSYKPSPRKIALLEESDLFIYNGLNLEPWADKLARNLKGVGVRSIKMSKNINLLQIDDHHHNKDHTKYDPHIWLNPQNMKLIAKRMMEEFIKLDPTNEKFYRDNYKDYISKIDKLDNDFQKLLDQRKSEYILVSHAAFGYLTHHYGLHQLAVTGIAPHQEPSPRTLAKLVKKAREHEIDYIYMETLANPRTAEILAQEADLKIAILNPIAGLTEEDIANNEDYFSLMRKNLESLRKELVN